MTGVDSVWTPDFKSAAGEMLRSGIALGYLGKVFTWKQGKKKPHPKMRLFLDAGKGKITS